MTMVTSETLASIIESIVFVSGNPIAAKDIAEKLETTEARILETAKKIQEKYDGSSGINLLIFNNKLQFCSNPKYADDVAVVLNPIRERELSRSMLEVAAIIAYKQPVTRLDLEQIRGVDSEYAVQNLLKLGVIEPVGRKDAIGRPVLFGTTDAFLKRFQISSLNELPDYDTLLSSIKTEESSTYLFDKDVYDASEDPELQDGTLNEENGGEEASSSEEPPAENGENAGESKNEEDRDGEANFIRDDDYEPCDIEDEELPDYLKGEDVVKID